MIAKTSGFKVNSDGNIHFRGSRNYEAQVIAEEMSFRDPIAESSNSGRLVNFSGMNTEKIQVLTGSEAAHGGYQSALPSATTESLLQLHLYKLPYRVTLRDETITEINMIPRTNIKTRTYYEFDRYRPPPRVQVYVELLNSDSVGLGMPLPPGELQVYKVSEAGTPEFVAEDRIRHLAEDGKLRIRVGEAADIKVSSERLDYVGHSAKKYDETWEIRIENQKEFPVELTYRDRFAGKYKMIETTYPFKEINERSIELPLTIKAGEEVVIRYTVRVVIEQPRPERRR